jgi:hypothetical protein
MNILNLVMGFLLLLLGLIIMILMINKKDNAIFDKYGANTKIYGASIISIVAGIILIMKELFG